MKALSLILSGNMGEKAVELEFACRCRLFQACLSYMNDKDNVKDSVSETEADRIKQARAIYCEFHARCFWFLRKDLLPTAADLPEIARGLREHGGRRGYKLASRLCPCQR